MTQPRRVTHVRDHNGRVCHMVTGGHPNCGPIGGWRAVILQACRIDLANWPIPDEPVQVIVPSLKPGRVHASPHPASGSAFDATGLNTWGAVRQGWLDADAMVRKVKVEEISLRGLTLGGYDTRRAWAVVNGVGFDLAGVNKALVEHKRRPLQGMLGNLDLLNGSVAISALTSCTCGLPRRR